MLRKVIKKEVTNIMKATQRYQLGLIDEAQYENIIYRSAEKINTDEIALINYEKKVGEKN